MFLLARQVLLTNFTHRNLKNTELNINGLKMINNRTPIAEQRAWLNWHRGPYITFERCIDLSAATTPLFRKQAAKFQRVTSLILDLVSRTA